MIFIISLIGFFLLTRLYHLMSLPIFMDEALYYLWTKAVYLQHDWLISLREGWEPLQIWASYLLTLITKQPLLSLRLFSVLTGAGSAIVIYKLGKIIFPKLNLSLLSLALLITSPFVLVHDRLGMRDSGVVLIGLLCLYGAAKRFLYKDSHGSLIIALSLMLGFLLKNITWFFSGFTLLSFIFFRPKLKRFDLLLLILPALPLLFYWLTGTLGGSVAKNQIFILSSLPSLVQIKVNLIQIVTWWFQYATAPIFILILAGIFIAWIKYRPTFWLLSIFILPALVFEIIFNKILFPRYALFSFVFTLFFAALSLKEGIKKPWLIFLFFILVLKVDYQLLTDFTHAPLPAIERWQYITGWPSGYGVSEAADYLISLDPAKVWTTDHLLFQGLTYYQPNIPVTKYDSLNNQTLETGDYLIHNIQDMLPENLSLTEIKRFYRPDNQSFITLYQYD